MPIPICLRFGRLFVDNFSHFSNSAALNSRSTISKYATTTVKENVSSRLKSTPTVGIRHTSTATEERNKTGDTTSTEAQNVTEPEKTSKEQIESLTQEVESLTKQTKDLMDKYKRALADGENLRKRLSKQIVDAKLYGIQGFCKDMLEVADTLTKATESVPKEEASEKNPHLKSLYEGLRMTEAELKQVFRRHGLEQVNPVDKKFDPNQHEALFEQEVAGKEAGTVIVVSKVGYKLHDRIIRPALVGVAKESANATEKAA